MPSDNDPLNCIPSVSVIEKRLRDSEVQTRRLRVLLKTAKQIEKEGQKLTLNNKGSHRNA